MNALALSAQTTSQLIAGSVALVGVIIGGLITLATTRVQNRAAREERQAAEASARRERMAQVLGRVRTFLTDIEPERIGFNANPQTTPEEMKALAGRLNTLRDELS
ncbi:MAG: hypothetical protein H0U05_00300, partial [Actinobacteria bacterium]|nr:hypothetical protein [Actinomycetota bacterium]